MANNLVIDEEYIATITESYIKSSEKLTKLFSTDNHACDFKCGDVVKCTYLKGLYKVMGPNNEHRGIQRVNIYPIDMSKEFFPVRPQFLKKEEVRDDTIKVLYES